MSGQKPSFEEQSKVLKVALTPPAIPLQFIQECGGHLLVTAVLVMEEPDLPAAAAHEGRLDKVVTQDIAPQRRLPRQLGQAAVLHERLHADDGIVAPEV